MASEIAMNRSNTRREHVLAERDRHTGLYSLRCEVCGRLARRVRLRRKLGDDRTFGNLRAWCGECWEGRIAEGGADEGS